MAKKTDVERLTAALAESEHQLAEQKAAATQRDPVEVLAEQVAATKAELKKARRKEADDAVLALRPQQRPS